MTMANALAMGFPCMQPEKELEINTSLDDDDNPQYQTSDFRVFYMKVIPCSKRFCHDWTTCPFAHPGEKARRRDPRQYAYTGIACPDMKKTGMCARGDRCPYAHNVFEYWLHPTRYRSQLCNDGVHCRRRVCFFAHTTEHLRVPQCKPFVPPELLASLQAEVERTQPAYPQMGSSPDTHFGMAQSFSAGTYLSTPNLSAEVPMYRSVSASTNSGSGSVEVYHRQLSAEVAASAAQDVYWLQQQQQQQQQHEGGAGCVNYQEVAKGVHTLQQALQISTGPHRQQMVNLLTQMLRDASEPQDTQALGGPTGTARHASTPLPGAGAMRAGLQQPQFDPSAVFGSAAAQSFDAPWPGPSAAAAVRGALARAPSGEEPGDDSLSPLEGGATGGSRGGNGESGVQRRTESEPVAAFARRAQMPVLSEFVALGMGGSASAEAARGERAAGALPPRSRPPLESRGSTDAGGLRGYDSGTPRTGGAPRSERSARALLTLMPMGGAAGSAEAMNVADLVRALGLSLNAPGGNNPQHLHALIAHANAQAAAAPAAGLTGHRSAPVPSRPGAGGGPTPGFNAPPVTAGAFTVGSGSPVFSPYMVQPGQAAAAAGAGAAERVRSIEMLRQIGGARPGAMAAQYQHMVSMGTYTSLPPPARMPSLGSGSQPLSPEALSLSQQLAAGSGAGGAAPAPRGAAHVLPGQRRTSG
ncbi:hypothetical protein WJX81_004739 [Elliptochloris bilobata]|uniref:C3H1-type domain-containing protein n=1 Tax=Elliptochloris bilobata TaxID=381761 RepID=A0AAW1QYR5_9CHLO